MSVSRPCTRGGPRARHALAVVRALAPQTPWPGEQAGVLRPPPLVSSSRSPAGVRARCRSRAAVWPVWWDQRARPLTQAAQLRSPLVRSRSVMPLTFTLKHHPCASLLGPVG